MTDILIRLYFSCQINIRLSYYLPKSRETAETVKMTLTVFDYCREVMARSN